MENETEFEELEEASMIEEGSEKPLDDTVNFVYERFQRAKTKKLSDETRFLKAYKNFRGLYDKDLAFTDKEKSKVFVKVALS